MNDPESIALVAGLTPREREVLIFAAKGATYQHTADFLGISKDTVHHHLKNIHAAFNAPTTVECAVIAAKAGIV